MSITLAAGDLASLVKLMKELYDLVDWNPNKEVNFSGSGDMADVAAVLNNVSEGLRQAAMHTLYKCADSLAFFNMSKQSPTTLFQAVSAAAQGLLLTLVGARDGNGALSSLVKHGSLILKGIKEFDSLILEMWTGGEDGSSGCASGNLVVTVRQLTQGEYADLYNKFGTDIVDLTDVNAGVYDVALSVMAAICTVHSLGANGLKYAVGGGPLVINERSGFYMELSGSLGGLNCCTSIMAVLDIAGGEALINQMLGKAWSARATFGAYGFAYRNPDSAEQYLTDTTGSLHGVRAFGIK